MGNYEERDPGFYWVSVAGVPVEPARWDAEGQGWVLLGIEMLVPSGEAEVVVIKGPMEWPVPQQVGLEGR